MQVQREGGTRRVPWTFSWALPQRKKVMGWHWRKQQRFSCADAGLGDVRHHICVSLEQHLSAPSQKFCFSPGNPTTGKLPKPCHACFSVRERPLYPHRAHRRTFHRRNRDYTCFQHAQGVIILSLHASSSTDHTLQQALTRNVRFLTPNEDPFCNAAMRFLMKWLLGRMC